MTVTVFLLQPHEVYRVFEDVDRTEHTASPDIINLYTKTNLLASFGPGYCWAIETEEVTP